MQDHANTLWNNLINFQDLGFRLKRVSPILEKHWDNEKELLLLDPEPRYIVTFFIVSNMS